MLGTLGNFGHPNSLLLASGLGLYSMLGVLRAFWVVERLFQGCGRGALRGRGPPHSPAACGTPPPSGTACKPENLFQGSEGSEPGEGGQAPGTAQQPRVQGVALPGLGRTKGWSFDGKQEVRGAQAVK